MVFQKRLDSGYIGYQIPKMPRFPRSARGKRSRTKKGEVNQMSPFDLLATVAGELLTKRNSNCSLYGLAETSTPVNKIEQVQLDNGSPSKSDIFDQGSSQENNFVARFVSHGPASFDFEEHLRNPAEKNAASALALVKCDVSDKDAFAGSLKKNVVGFHKFDDPMDFDTKATAPVCSDSCVEIIPIGDSHSAGRSSFPSVGDGIELLVDRDDAENYSGRIHSSELYAMAFKRHCIGDSRVRKLLTSNYWKADRKALNDGELLNDGEEIKPVFRSRMMCYTRQRTKRSSLKRRKLSESCSFSACNGGSCNHDVPDPLVNDDIKLDSFDTHADLNGAHGRSCSMGGGSSSYESDNHVKLSIKSFRVPELFIEIPANATVGSLKRTVMDAVTSILGGGLRVGVLHQGKKIRDDNKTILQAGISNADKSDNLGFTLEPNPTEATQPPNSLFHESEPVTKFNASAAPTLDQGTYNAHSPTANCTDGELDSVHSASNASSSIDRLNDNSKALVPIFGVNPETLSIIPLNNSKRSEMVQRRIRRPFSVLEVESLVQAVEKLGTGRWRDVKHRAFDNAKHRTYVDLKDKWKTLVHTARISPQQRRGEPVPQELLDRVLSAHDYWSRQQVKSTVLSEQCLHSSEFNACPLDGCHRFDRV